MKLLHFYKPLFLSLLFLTLVIASCESPPPNKINIASEQINPGLTPDDLTKGDSLFKLANYDSASYYYIQASETLKIRKEWELFVITRLKLSDILRLQGNSNEVEKTLLEAEAILSEYLPSDNKLIAEILHKRGLLFLDKGSFDSATSLINLSIKLKSKVLGINDTSLSMNYNALGTAYFYKVDYVNALKNYTLAYELASKRKYPEDADLAMYLQNIGIINAQRGEYEKAEKAFTSSLRINEKLLKADDPELSMIYLNVGRLKSLLSKDAEAMALYNKAENILLKSKGTDHQYIKFIYQNKGQTYVHMADYEKALIYFNKALVLSSETYKNNHPQILSLNMNIGYVHEKKGDYNNALKYYKLSIPTEGETPSLIKTYSNLASLYNSMKDPVKADEYYIKALTLSNRLHGAEHPETGLLYTRYGYFLLANKKNQKGLVYIEQALSINIKNHGLKSREVSNNLTQIGNYYLTRDKASEALNYYQKAINSIVKEFNNLNVYANPTIKQIEADRYLVNALNGKGQALEMMNGERNLINSLNTFKLSVKVINKLRSAYQDEESKLLVSAEEKRTFQLAVNTAIKLYELTRNKEYLSEAFQYSDKSKSAVLINSMHEVEAHYYGKIPKNILDSEKQLKLSLSTFRRFIYEEQQKPVPNIEMVNLWESRVFEFTVRYDSLVNFLEKQYPEYYNLKYNEPSVSINNIQSALEEGTTLIEYMLSDTTLHMFAINKKNFKVFTIYIDSSFYKDIETLVSITSNNSMLNTNEESYFKYSKAGYNLYKTLIEPLKVSFNDKKLVIIPDGEIGYISFDMLLTKQPDLTSMDFRDLHYLIKDKVISYSTSAVLQFSNFRKRERKASRNLLAMAPSYNNLTDNENIVFKDENGKKIFLLPIPGVEKEIKSIRSTLSMNDFTGKSATEKRFKSEVGKYNVLHLAMHTLINGSQPMLSKLVFYQDSDTIEDGLLNTYELFSMDLNAGLAVLSACNTGTGKLIKGEGIMSLARGFIFAGVPSIVMTMWSVEDQSSVDIVSNFYKYLEDGMSKDDALRQAKLDLLAKGDPLKSHPFYWAAYVNIGDRSPMKFTNNILTYSLLSVSVLLLTSMFIFFRKKEKLVKTNKHTYLA